MTPNETLKQQIEQFCEDLFRPKIPYGSIPNIGERAVWTAFLGTEQEFKARLAAFAESLQAAYYDQLLKIHADLKIRPKDEESNDYTTAELIDNLAHSVVMARQNFASEERKRKAAEACLLIPAPAER